VTYASAPASGRHSPGSRLPTHDHTATPASSCARAWRRRSVSRLEEAAADRRRDGGAAAAPGGR
jgi:hypothetical protein